MAGYKNKESTRNFFLVHLEGDIKNEIKSLDQKV